MSGREDYCAVEDAALDDAASVRMAAGVRAGWMMTVLVLVDPVGDSAESGATTTTVRVDVAERPDWAVVT